MGGGAPADANHGRENVCVKENHGWVAGWVGKGGPGHGGRAGPIAYGGGAKDSDRDMREHICLTLPEEDMPIDALAREAGTYAGSMGE